MQQRILLVALVLIAPLGAQVAPVSLPEVTVYSTRVANQSPTGTFATPVSPLRYEPQVDVQARNLTEAQADVTIRGGIFENIVASICFKSRWLGSGKGRHHYIFI